MQTFDRMYPGGGRAGEGRTRGRRKVTYCVVPSDLAEELHEALREHWREEESVIVVVERRRSDRRHAERRFERTEPEPERRRILSPSGRRTGDRRVVAVQVSPIELPAIAAPHADRLLFVERLEPRGRAAEDAETNRLIVRVQAGESGAFDLLYLRYFDRVYAYARVALRDAHEAEDLAQQVFINVIEALPRYEVREETPFRSWLFRITRNLVLRTVSRAGRLQPEEPDALERRMENPAPESAMELDWLSDDDLARLVERLPMSQRQVVLLRYLFEFTTAEIAEAMERTPVAVRMLEHRAIRALEARLAALRGRAERCDRSSMVRLSQPTPVLQSRRLALRGF